MRADINHDKKLILVWKSTQEADNEIPDELMSVIAPLRQKNYKLIVMKSGTADLFEESFCLLKTNRMKMAEQEVEAERRVGQTTEPALPLKSACRKSLKSDWRESSRC